MSGRTRLFATERTRLWAAALTGLGLGVLALGPGLAGGFVLSYDMVFVPDPVFSRFTFGLTGTVPRHVPSDAFVTALSTLIPGDLVQKLVLLAVFVMACTSAAALVPSERLPARLAAGVCYAWNPFVAERLLLGHWALLLGYAALPWVVGAACVVTERGGGWRLARALLPAAVGGFAAMAVSGLTAVIVAVTATSARARAFGRTAVAVVVLSSPWLITGLLRPSGLPADRAAVEAFAARADTPFGTLGSLLLLGGGWNRETVPTGYGMALTATAWLAVVAVALVVYALGRRSAGPGHRWTKGLGLAAVVGFAVASLGAVAPALLERLIAAWPGFAVFRDGQQYVAPVAVVVAVGLGLGVDRITRGDLAGRAMGVLAVLVPVALLPSLAWGAGGRLHAVDYPRDWARARAIIEADRAPGEVLVLPWAAHRGYRWNDRRRVLDPLPRYLHREVIVNDAVTVGSVVIPAEDPRVRELDPLIRSGAELTGPLRAAGVRYVFVDDPFPGATAPGTTAPRDRLAGAELLLDRPDVTLFRIPRA
ncbi:hypothetical protein [Actinomadura sp. HBU206391]|uniref:hypothetical protein n=1 Tax=Actinomadura sp. HBU206391 TaxID=2731692 RepID=UPI0016505334|nr:hypothetical protein [Actinomadura sp. HBU206391]MBC6456825.1 hypothetical protein [Actinomadura sp. HBU206391]